VLNYKKRGQLNNKMNNSEKYKNKIIKCAEEIVSGSGFGSLSITAIANTCKISKSTFYNFFKSKDDLIQLLQSNTGIEPDIQSTKQRIIDKAAAHFSNSHYTEIDLETIAQSAGIKRSSLYRYFSSKEELLEAVILNELKNRESLVESLKKELTDPLEFFTKYIEYFDYYANNNYTSLLYATSIYYSKSNPRIKECFDNLRKYTENVFFESLEMGKKIGVFKSEFNTGVYAKMLFSVMAGINVHSPSDFSLVAKSYLDLLYKEIKII